MGLYKYLPEPSGRMGLLWTVGTVGESAVLEFGSMGHMIYADRWLSLTGADNRSKLYTTHIDEKDIALGLTSRLTQAMEEIIRTDYPGAVFVLPSVIPEIIGTDLSFLCEELQNQYEDVPIISFRHGGFQDKLTAGVEEGLYQLVRRLPKVTDRTAKRTFNIIGSCADQKSFRADAEELVRLCDEIFEMEPVCILTSDTTVSKIKQMGSAHVNLVLRREGVKAAGHLQERFGIPYLYGEICGGAGTAEWIKQLKELLHP